ncbi:MAG: DNA mismatch repair protein MutS [Blastochloris sp.]|nr:DNA mismatch repair protein MutS [Blastochloris sp.]
MMQQYRRIKSEIPKDALLLFRLGDFYEMFFEDAKDASALLNLTLTKRNGIPMCGMPYHAAENYISRLIQAGRRVALCDQVSEPRPGQIVERQVTQILSPGSVFSLEMTQPKENRFLASLCPRPGELFGFAFVDLTTGEFRLTEIQGARAVEDEFLKLQPKELIHPSETAPGLNLDQHPLLAVGYDDWIFETDHARLTLQEHFKVQSLDGYGCQDSPAGIAAAGALLHYVINELKINPQHILKIQPYSGQEHLIIDSITQRNLELLSSGGNASTDTSLLKAMDQSVTAMGGRELRRWIVRPLRDKAAIEKRQQVVAEWLQDVQQLEDFRRSLAEVRDLERLVGRMVQGSGNARDLVALKQSLQVLPALRGLLQQLATPRTRELLASLHELPEAIELIERAIRPEPPLSLKDGGIIQDGYNAEVDELRQATTQGKAWIAELQAREQERSGIKSLKIRYNSVFGYYIEITKSNLHQVPADYSRKQTLVNAERYITPELKEMESKILGAEERVKQLEYQLFLDLRESILAYTPRIQESAQSLAELDVLSGFAISARLHNHSRPQITTNGRMKVSEGRHPVLEQLLRGERFVPNDVDLHPEECRLMIITGPNMAGKSTYIRQVALIALMAHTGSYVPAQEATVPILDRIFTRVGANDDLSRGQSTFMVEMNETANILNNATAQSLVILDEIGRGTSTFDGLSIAWSVAEFLHNEVRAKTLFATHYHELTELAVFLPGIKNFNVAVREWHDQIIFLRKIVPGGTDKSYGIQVARLAGLPKSVIDRSKEILRNLEENELDATGKPQLAAHRGKKENSGSSSQKQKADIPQMDLFKSK